MSNIIGNPFSPWVTDEINLRQEVLGRQNFSNSDLNYINGKAPWARLASSVDVGEDEGKLAKDNILSFGLTNESGKFNYGLEAYKIGGIGERGYVPLPGITNIDVQYYNNGALAKATVNIKCFNKQQFEIIDKLYMRPGYSLLLEFGWSKYLERNSNGEIQSKDFDIFSSTPLTNFLKGGKNINQYSIYKDIQNIKKDYKGNYEAISGMISNFNWSINPDGTYNIQTQIIGYGNIIESLKVNIFPNKKSVEDDNSENEDDIPSISIIHKFLTRKENLLNNQNLSIIENTVIEAGFSEVFINKFPFINQRLTIEKGLLCIIPNTAGDKNVNYYISFGALMAAFQKYLIPRDEEVSTCEFNFDWENLDTDENFISVYDGMFSSNPNICLVPPYMSDTPKINTLPFKKYLRKNLNTFYEDNNTKGRLSSIMVNTNFVRDCIEGIDKDKEGNISLLMLLKNIIRGITESLGGYNKISINSEGPYINFVDEIPFYKSDNTQTFAKFNIFGVNNKIGSFVKDISVNGNISNNFASAISIGAQANGVNVSEDATSFSTYNKDLIDRIIKEKTIVTDNTKDKNSTEDELKISLDEIYPTFEEVYGKFNWNSDHIDYLKEYNTQQAILKAGLEVKEGKKLPFFLPFTMQITMDGLSGMKLYEKFRVTEDVLPPAYNEDNLDLIVKGINHKVDTQSWDTTLDVITVPRPQKVEE